MFETLGKFVAERAGSLVSKKLGAAVAAETLIAETNPAVSGIGLITYIVVQAALEAYRHKFAVPA